MKKMLIANTIKATCRNAREESLIRIINRDIDDNVEYLKKGKKLQCVSYDINGLLSAAFYLGIIERPATYCYNILVSEGVRIDFNEYYKPAEPSDI